MTHAKRSEDTPHDRLTALADQMVEVLDKRPDCEEVQAVVLLDEGDRGGMVMHGFDDDSEAVSMIFAHLDAIFEMHGQRLMITEINGAPESN